MLRCAVVLISIVLLIGCEPGEVLDPGSGPPTVSIDAPGIGPEGSSIPFNAQSSGPDGRVRTFAWSFGDGAKLVTSNPHVRHAYRNNGSYVTTLIVSDSHGAADTASKTMTIANVEPQITLLKIPDTVVAGSQFSIEIQYHDPGVDDTVTAMLWVWHGNAGGGGGLAGPGTYMETYDDPGEYTLGVVVWDNDGGVGERAGEHPIVVVPRPSSQIVARR